VTADEPVMLGENYVSFELPPLDLYGRGWYPGNVHLCVLCRARF